MNKTKQYYEGHNNRSIVQLRETKCIDINHLLSHWDAEQSIAEVEEIVN